ncbi:LysM peptidoglycan-binding domain-containing protein [Oceanibium sediminis]|uniref:LysM peptidoglycan-binding domain-containing protein n=1 Tax=Oceanibium sediminis TaxID=2026339 RepID=UPI000DD398AF|nr:LysM peptidoglycan-binding domain-containing protein [Oceanibium sediminis]
MLSVRQNPRHTLVGGLILLFTLGAAGAWAQSAPVMPATAMELAAASDSPAPPIWPGSCPVHVVREGDSLGTIAERYLGDQNRASEVYRANRSLVGRNPNIIVAGLRLTIPCDTSANPAMAERIGPPPPPLAAPHPPSPPAVLTRSAPGSASGLSFLISADDDGATQAISGPKVVTTSATAGDMLREPSAAQPTRKPATPDLQAPVHVLTGAPYLPFIDPDKGDGGMVTELILAAFSQTPGGPLEIGFVNDRDAHLDIILPRGGFAFSFPWIMPDCTAPQQRARERRLCETYIVSDSLYEHVTEFFSRADSPFAEVRTLADIAGARVCRPAGYPVQDLQDAGLLPDALTLEHRPSPRACLEALDAGEVDIASLDATLARAIVTGMTLKNPLIVLENLTRIDRLRAVALRGDPTGAAAIARLNQGLGQLVETGTWYGIVNAHLTSSGM